MVTKSEGTKTKKAAAKPAAKAPKAAAARDEQSGSAGKTLADAPLTRHRPTLVGVVVSDKMQKTIVVEVERRVKHGLYGKYVVRSNRYKAHDEKNTAKIGDLVSLVQCRPMSRDKRWALQNIVRRGNATGALELV
jgi:small subunit ribosomal protein S17